MLALLCAAALLSPPSRAWDRAVLRSAAQRLGPGALAALPDLQALLTDARSAEVAQRLAMVNDFFNQHVAYASDLDVWGQDDYWATPLQTLAMARGDCEDFAIAKYAVLLATGTAPERLRLVYVRARLPDQSAPIAHMVLAYTPTPGAEPLILDSLQPQVLPAARRPDLTPVFSFSSAGLWQGIAGATAGDPMARLSRWRDVWSRIRAEGLP